MQYVPENVGSEVADMGKIVYRWTAGIHPHFAGVDGVKILFRSRQGIKKSKCHGNLFGNLKFKVKNSKSGQQNNRLIRR
jgi:hypothetical protein